MKDVTFILLLILIWLEKLTLLMNKAKSLYSGYKKMSRQHIFLNKVMLDLLGHVHTLKQHLNVWTLRKCYWWERASADLPLDDLF